MALMVSCFMPLSQSTVWTRVSRLSKWQAIKALHTGIELRQGCDSFLLFFVYGAPFVYPDLCNVFFEYLIK